MFEKVNPNHPDKIADRIAGAIVDLGYAKEKDPKIAAEVLIGHSECNIIIETNVSYTYNEIMDIVKRITGLHDIKLNLKVVKQDSILASNQETLKCGDNGIFKGVPTNAEEKELARVAHNLYAWFKTDGKYIINNDRLIICQSNGTEAEIRYASNTNKEMIVNPLGYWTGGINVDCGATNRKLGSDMGRAVTGGGLHGKDLSKADVAVNIYLYLKAQETGETQEAYCAIGDDNVNGIDYQEIVNVAKSYIDKIGGFEKLGEWGLI